MYETAPTGSHLGGRTICLSRSECAMCRWGERPIAFTLRFGEDRAANCLKGCVLGHRVIMAAAIAGLLSSVPAWADGPAGQAAPAPAASTDGAAATSTAAQDPDEIVCRHTDPPIGSHIGGSTICQSRRKWDQDQKNAEDFTRKIEQNRVYQPPGS